MESKELISAGFNNAGRIVNDIVDESYGEVLMPVYIPESTWKDSHFLLKYTDYTVEALVCRGESAEDFDHPEFWDKENFKIFSYSIWVEAAPTRSRKRAYSTLLEKYPHCAGGKTQVEFASFTDMMWDSLELFKDIDKNG